MSKVKCRHCKEKIDKESAFSPREKLYFCDQECYRKWRKTDDGQLDALLDYVWHLYSPNKQTSSTYVMIKKQAEHYHNVEGFKYQGMFLAIRYYVEILERLWCDDYGLGQVFPTYYIALQNMYEEQRALKSKLNNMEDTKERIVQGKQYVTRRRELSLD